MDNNNLKIGELAELTGFKQTTIKFYSEIGLIPFKQQDTRSARRFNLQEAGNRLKEIKKLKDKRLRIDEIIEHFKSKK